MQCYPLEREAGRLERTGTILYNRECTVKCALRREQEMTVEDGTMICQR